MPVDPAVSAPAAAPSPAAPEPSAWAKLRGSFPHSGNLPLPSWTRRHWAVGLAAALHVPFLLAYGLRHQDATTLAGGLLVAGLCGAAALPGPRTARALTASLALVLDGPLAARATAGAIDAHLHFLAALAAVSLYQAWVPLLSACLVLFVHDGLALRLDPAPAIASHAWRLALVDLALAGVAVAASVAQFRLAEGLRADAQALVEMAPDGILAIDRRGRITSANAAAGLLLGQPAEALAGRHAAEVLPGVPIPRPPAWREATWPREWNVQRPDGSRMELECVLTTTRRHGRVRGHVVGMRDISGRRQAEAARLAESHERAERLRELDALKTRFLRNAAHELHTPLVPLQMQVELLRLRLAAATADQGSEATQAALRHADVLERNFTRLQRLVDDLLDAVRLDAGKLRLSLAAVDARACVLEVIELFGPMAQTAHVGLAMPEADAPVGLVRADALRLTQALSNLVANAIRFTPAGGMVSLSVSAAAGAEGTSGIAPGMVRIEVRDTGAGLSAEQAAALFQPFAQVQNVAAERTGTGLGLHITRSLIELHGGALWVESPGPGLGTTFILTLPAWSPADAASPEARGPKRSEGAATPGGRPLVTMVERPWTAATSTPGHGTPPARGAGGAHGATAPRIEA